MHSLIEDARYALRGFRKAPGFTLVAVLTLALGIGANAAIFSVVNAVLLKPLPYAQPEQLVTLLHHGTAPVSFENYNDWRDEAKSFQAMAAAEYWTPNLTGGDEPQHLYALHVTQNLLAMLGVQPQLGRLFLPEEEREGNEHVAVISAGLWQREFAGDRNAIGRSVMLDGAPYTIIGVMPAEFRFAPFWATKAELWAPIVPATRDRDRGGNSLRIFARLKPGVTLAQAQAEMATITGRLEQQYPGTNRDVRVTSLREKVVGDITLPLLVLLGAVAFVLLIACVNLAHMMLARATERQKEVAVRAALGASRWRIVRQSMLEALILAALGASGALLLAMWGTRALIALSPAELPGLHKITIDSAVLGFMAAITVLTALAFGLAPALRTQRVSLTDVLSQAARGSSEGRRQSRMRSILLVSEFALALMLMVGAGLLMRSFFALQAIDPGFNPHNVLSMVVSIKGTNEEPAGPREIFYREVLNKLASLPGVESAGGINHLPLIGDEWSFPFRFEGRPKPLPSEYPNAVYRLAMPGYLRTMQIPLLRGRDLSPADNQATPGVVIVNEAFVRKYFSPGDDPIGKRIVFGNPEKGAPWLTIIGTAKDARQEEWAAAPEPEAYLAALQNKEYLEDPSTHTGYLTVVVRTQIDPAKMIGSVRAAVRSFDLNLPISQVTTMDDAVASANAQPRFELTLLGVFAGLAVVLAAVGIFGVMSYAVTRRTHEIGIRMSLGATTADVLRMVLGSALINAAAGALAGVAGALLFSRLMRSMLYGVRPSDPLTISGAAVIVIGIALLASYVPARAATRVDPNVALRHN